MIYDCFQFFNELDILKLRMGVLNPYVDRFVISEATTTFSGLEKPLYYLENRDMFKQYEHKIIHVTVDDTPEGGTHERDTFQKNAVGRGLTGLNDEDIVIYSDLDEIPNPKRIQEILKDFRNDRIYHFAQRLFYGYLNMEEISGNLLSYAGEFEDIFDLISQYSQSDDGEILAKCFGGILPVRHKWIGSKMCSYKLLRERKITLGMLRFPEMKEIGIRVEDGGWHFGYMGGSGESDIKKRITEKVKSAAHDEYNSEKVLSRAADNIKDGRDLFGRNSKFTRTLIDDSYPEYLIKHLDDYKHLILQDESGYIKTIRHIHRNITDAISNTVLEVKRQAKKIAGRS